MFERLRRPPLGRSAISGSGTDNGPSLVLLTGPFLCDALGVCVVPASNV